MLFFVEHLQAALPLLSLEERGELLTALLAHVEHPDVKPEFSDGSIQMAYNIMAKAIDANYEHYDKVCEKRAEAARRRNDANASKSMQMSQMQANEGNTSTSTSTGTSSSTSTGTSTSTSTSTSKSSLKGTLNSLGANARTTKTTKSSWRAPSVDEVQEYCLERGNTVDPEAFVDYYEANGWMVGRSHMKDWKAAVRTWERKETAKGGSSSGMFMAEAERLEREGWS